MSHKNENMPNDQKNQWSNNKNSQSNANGPESDYEIEERLANIFNRLDRSGNGRIDIQDLISALKGVGMSQQYAEVSVNPKLTSHLIIDNKIFLTIIYIFPIN